MLFREDGLMDANELQKNEYLEKINHAPYGAPYGAIVISLLICLTLVTTVVVLGIF